LAQSLPKNALNLDPLDKIGWLSDQPQDFQRWVALNGRWRRYAEGQVLYLAGEEPDGLYGLARGVLEVSFPLSGDEPVAIHRSEPGFWIGEAAILAGETRMVSLTAATESLVFFLPVGPLRRLIEAEPRYWQPLYEQSNRNTRNAVTLLAESLSLSPRARLARLLLRVADERGEVPGSQEGLGRLVGMTRSSMRRSLASLTEAGAIRCGYGKISIVDNALLARLSSEA
jgi:CRP-like cAMP-binding protein